MNVLIVDDEPLARENVRCLLEEHDDIEIIGECANAIEAISLIHKKAWCGVFRYSNASRDWAGNGTYAGSWRAPTYRLSDRI